MKELLPDAHMVNVDGYYRYLAVSEAKRDAEVGAAEEVDARRTQPSTETRRRPRIS
jgi:hypothetical protein